MEPSPIFILFVLVSSPNSHEVRVGLAVDQLLEVSLLICIRAAIYALPPSRKIIISLDTVVAVPPSTIKLTVPPVPEPIPD